MLRASVKGRSSTHLPSFRSEHLGRSICQDQVPAGISQLDEIIKGGRMRSAHFGLLLSIVFLNCPVWAQQTQPPSLAQPDAQQTTQGSAVLQRSLTALFGGTSINDVLLNGSVTVTNGMTTESGTIMLVATSGGQSKTTLTMPSGLYTDIRNYTSSGHTGTITAPDGSQTLSLDALQSPHPAWFFPAFLMSSTLTATDYDLSYAGREQRVGATVDHATFWNHPIGVPPLVALAFQTDTQQDIYIDSSSSLPVSLALNLPGTYQDTSIQHWNKSVTVPEEIRFSDYRPVQGCVIAFHIQVYIARNLFYDIQISSASVNAGVAITASN
jgi:hypothetical protein